MFDKERELVEIGPHSYNLKEGGFGGFDKSKQPLFRLAADDALKTKYGDDWRHHLALLGSNGRNRVCKEQSLGLFNPYIRKAGCDAALSQVSREKRIQSYQKIRHQQGTQNSQFGTMWITDGNVNRKTKKNDAVPNGWYKGRTHFYPTPPSNLSTN